MLQRKTKSTPTNRAPFDGGSLQRAAIRPDTPQDHAALPSVVHDVLHSPGQPLDPGTRASMGPAFGHDFSSVRVHTDAPAAASAQAVNARAYTVGHNLVFGASQYNPDSQHGQRLLAHELTHIVQQSRSSTSIQSSGFDSPDSSAEREADFVGDQVVAGQAFSVPRAQP